MNERMSCWAAAPTFSPCIPNTIRSVQRSAEKQAAPWQWCMRCLNVTSCLLEIQCLNFLCARCAGNLTSGTDPDVLGSNLVPSNFQPHPQPQLYSTVQSTVSTLVHASCIKGMDQKARLPHTSAKASYNRTMIGGKRIAKTCRKEVRIQIAYPALTVKAVANFAQAGPCFSDGAACRFVQGATVPIARQGWFRRASVLKREAPKLLASLASSFGRIPNQIWRSLKVL